MGMIVLTVSAVASPRRIPRQARYRANYARRPQMAFEIKGDSLVQSEQHSDDGLIYALVIHGPVSRRQPYTLGFIHVVFLDRQARAILARIDLLKRFPDITTGDQAAETTVITEATPKLRPRKAAEKGREARA
jgi:hypothetical protein